MKNNRNDPHRYDDPLNLPHHVSAVHPHMSLYDRAAQFAPFKALTGYEDDVEESARLTDERIDLDEDRIEQSREQRCPDRYLEHLSTACTEKYLSSLFAV